MILRPDTTPLGTVYPLNAPKDAEGYTVVRIMESADDVPDSEPMRYAVHLCDSVGGG